MSVERSDVWEEVAKTASYTGDKLTDSDEGAYERMMLTDEDRKTLERFWEETVAVANDRLRTMLMAGGMPAAERYEVTLEVSVAFDKVLVPSVQASLRSFFVKAMTGKWYAFCNKGEAADYLAGAAEMMEEVLRKLYTRRRPTRPTRQRAAAN